MVMLAFPGMGKTPLTKSNPIFIDLDFGFYRTSLDVAKEDEASLLKPFAKLAKMYVDQGFKVLTNEPKLLTVMKVDKMYLPKDPKYSARKLGVSEKQAASWIRDWAIMAHKYGVPVVYLSTGLDHYLGHKKGGTSNAQRKGN